MPQTKPAKPNASSFSRASYAKRKRLQGEGIDDIDAVQHKAHKNTHTGSMAKRGNDVELIQPDFNSKVARIYESMLNRFKGKFSTSSSSS